jgi:hypothetical protein
MEFGCRREPEGANLSQKPELAFWIINAPAITYSK